MVILLLLQSMVSCIINLIIQVNIHSPIVKLILSLICGLLIGLERETFNKPAGLRTYALVCLGSTIFTILAINEKVEYIRIASQVVTGIGFLGAGVIWKIRNKVQGLTTAAGLWVTASIGMAIGFGKYIIVISGVVLVLISLYIIGNWSQKILKK